MNKKSATKFLLFGSLFSLLSIILIIGCESSRVGPELPRPNPPAPAEQPLTLNGYVKDASNQTAIAGATVKLLKTDGTLLTTLLTNNSGSYSYDATNINENTLNVNASKDGYAFGSRIASLNKASNTAIVSDLLLTKLQVATTTVSVSSGGTASTTNTQSVANKPLTVQVPPNAVSSNIQLSVASLPAGQVPRPTTTNNAVVSAGQFGPSGTQFSQPVTINFPLPYARAAGTTFALMQLNETTGAYTNSGFTASVNADGTSASAQVTHFTVYTLQEGVTLTLNTPSTAIANEFYEKLESGTLSKPLSITNAVALTGSGGEVSEDWLKDEVASKLLLSIGSSEQTLTFSMKALPEKYTSSTGAQVGPEGHETESGTWEFRSYYALETTTTTGDASGPDWSRVITATSQKWIIISEGWYWIPHNQGSLFFGPY